MPYPLDIDCFMPLSEDRVESQKRLSSMACRVFREGPPSLDILAKSSDDELRTCAIYTADGFSGQLSLPDKCRFYLIPQQFSWGCLLISQEDFERLLSAHQICTSFLGVLECFGSRIKEPQYTCSSFNYNTWLASGLASQGEVFEVCYRMQYFERNGRNRGDPWSLRQTGIYQRFNEKSDNATWIILQLSSKVRSWFEGYIRSLHFSSDHPLLLHVLLLIALTTTYPEYLQHLSMQLEDLDEKAAFCSEPKRRKHDYKVSFADGQQLHLLQNKILRASLCIDDSLQMAASFDALASEFAYKNPHISSEELKANVCSYVNRMTAYKRNVLHLLQRSSNIASLLSKILESRTSRSLCQINQTMQNNLFLIQQRSTDTLHENTIMAKIAKEGTKDSKKVQALAFITTLYLPASLVATVFSSNLIQWKDSADNPTTGHVTKAHYAVVSEFWVYIVSTVVLTGVTLLLVKVAVKLNWTLWR